MLSFLLLITLLLRLFGASRLHLLLAVAAIASFVNSLRAVFDVGE